jgi:hypothetical protein
MLLALRAFAGLLYYDFIHSFRGFGRTYADIRDFPTSKRASNGETYLQLIDRICKAVTLASCFYLKPVLCLQKAFVTTRLLRHHGVAAEMVIGYRASPFFSHAWVEVRGKIIDGPPAFQEKLLVLDRL